MSARVKLSTLVALLGLAAPALADEPARPEGSPSKVRASHRVDVIAPGERVETVIDRLRASRPPAAAEARPQGERPVRPSDARPARERPAGERPGAPVGPMGPGGPSQPGGTSPPPPAPPDRTGPRVERSGR